MKRTKSTVTVLACSALSLLVQPASAGEIATYFFNNSLAAQQSGVASLVAVDPQGTSGFTTATVFGNTVPVYHFGGTASPSQQGGLTLNTSGLIASDQYSAQIVFSFADRNNAWRRILDSLDRQSDSGLYIDPGNNLDIYPVAAVSTGFTPNTFFDVVVTVDPSHNVNAYIGGALALTTNTTVLNLSTNTLGFFLDNVVSGGQGEWSQGNVARIRLFNTALTAREVAALDTDPLNSTPEPATWGLMLTSLLFIAGREVRRRF
jgi:hypothetical protein